MKTAKILYQQLPNCIQPVKGIHTRGNGSSILPHVDLFI
jgi:hypothetical protein